MLLCYSCSINISGIYSNYNKTIKEDPSKFIQLKDSALCYSQKNNLKDKICVIDGKTLKNCIKKNEKTLIYIWSPNCKSKYCIPLEIIQQRCDEKNIELYIVAEYYDKTRMDYHYDLKNNIFGIDVVHYDSNLISKYMDLFFSDISEQIKYKETNDRFFIFEKNTFSKSFYSIDEL
jgi:hypothetical protein